MCQWGCQMELLFKNTKQQSNLHAQGDLIESKLTVWVPCMGTEPNNTQQVWYVGIQLE